MTRYYIYQAPSQPTIITVASSIHTPTKGLLRAIEHTHGAAIQTAARMIPNGARFGVVVDKTVEN